MSIEYQDPQKEAEQIAHYSRFVESLFAVKFAAIKNGISQLEIEVKERLQSIRTSGSNYFQDELNVFFKYICQFAKKTTLLIKTLQENLSKEFLPDLAALLPVTTFGDAFEEGRKCKSQFLSQPKMIELRQDLDKGLTIDQLAAKYRTNTTKINHIVQLLQKSAPKIPEPPFETYQQFNNRLKQKLFKQYRDTKLHFMPQHSQMSPEELEYLEVGPPVFRPKRQRRRKKQQQSQLDRSALDDQQLHDLDLQNFQ